MFIDIIHIQRWNPLIPIYGMCFKVTTDWILSNFPGEMYSFFIILVLVLKLMLLHLGLLEAFSFHNITELLFLILYNLFCILFNMAEMVHLPKQRHFAINISFYLGLYLITLKIYLYFKLTMFSLR